MRLVFVSSTFKDMQFERDALKVRVAPRVDAFLAKYGENVHFGDLRWGVNTSELENEDSSRKVLKVCLDEIDDCRPYMIVFIGERYGWIPSGDLLKDTMKIKGIDNLPDDISVTNLEIEYGALLNPDFEGRVLFYFRNPINTSEMSEEERKIYEAESPTHKEKLEKLKEEIRKKYPNFIRTYDAKYDKSTKSLVGLEPLMDQINDDLQRIFDLDLSRLNALPKQERAVQNSHAFFERYYKNAYMRKEAVIYDFNDDYDDVLDSSEENFPLVEMIHGPNGSGRKTLLALKYKLSLERKDILTIPFVYNLDEFTDSEESFISTLIYKIEEKMGRTKFSNSSSIEYLVQLLNEQEKEKKFFINVFVANAGMIITRVINLLEALKPLWYTISFYLQDDNYEEEERDIPQFKYNYDTSIPPLDNDEKEPLIKAIAKSRHKEISEEVIKQIIFKEQSDNPLYLSLIVERLLMLDHEDFQNIRNLGDGMEAINVYMSQIIERSGNTLKDIAKDLIKEVIERTNPKMAIKLVAINTLENHLNKTAMEQLFEYYGWEFNDLDYSLFRRLVPSLFSISSSDDDSFWFKNDEIKEAAKELITQYHEDNHLDDIINWVEKSDKLKEKFIHKCKAIFYREKDDSEMFTKSMLEIFNEKGGNSLFDFSNEDLSRIFILTNPYINSLRDSYLKDDRFYEKVDEEIISALEKGKAKGYIPLLNIYYTYYINERHSTKEIIQFNNHHSHLTYQFIGAHQQNPGDKVLEEFAHFYAFMFLSIDLTNLDYFDDVEIIKQAHFVSQFITANKTVQYVQNMKKEGKYRSKTLLTSIFDSYKSAYKMIKKDDNTQMRTQFLLAIDYMMNQLVSHPELGQLFRDIFSNKIITIADKDKPSFCSVSQILYYAANLNIGIDDNKAKRFYENGNTALKSFLNSITIDDMRDEKVASELSESVEAILDYKEATKTEIDDDLASLIAIKLKIIHAFHPGDLKITLTGVKFCTQGKVYEGSFDDFRYYLPDAFLGMIALPKINSDDLYAMVSALGAFKNEYLYSDVTDYFAKTLIVETYDKNSDGDDIKETVFFNIYIYSDEFETLKTNDPFFQEVIDGIAELYEDETSKRIELLDEAREYIRQNL